MIKQKRSQKSKKKKGIEKQDTKLPLFAGGMIRNQHEENIALYFSINLLEKDYIGNNENHKMFRNESNKMCKNDAKKIKQF